MDSRAAVRLVSIVMFVLVLTILFVPSVRERIPWSEESPLLGPWRIWIVGGALLASFLFLQWIRRGRRLRGLDDFARQRGFAYQARIDDVVDAQLESLALFGRHEEAAGAQAFGWGRSSWRPGKPRSDLKNLMRSDNLLVFDYSYYEQRGDDRAIYQQTVVALRQSGRSLPFFELHPEGLHDRMVAAMGYQDIDFDDDPDFSGRYRLQGPEETMRVLFTPALRQELTRARPLWIDGGGEWVIFYNRSRLRSGQALADLCDTARQLNDAFSTAAGELKRHRSDADTTSSSPIAES